MADTLNVVSNSDVINEKMDGYFIGYPATGGKTSYATGGKKSSRSDLATRNVMGEETEALGSNVSGRINEDEEESENGDEETEADEEEDGADEPEDDESSEDEGPDTSKRLIRVLERGWEKSSFQKS